MSAKLWAKSKTLSELCVEKCIVLMYVTSPSLHPLFFLLIFTYITSSYYVLYRYSSINIDNNIIIRCLSPIYNITICSSHTNTHKQARSSSALALQRFKTEKTSKNKMKRSNFWRYDGSAVYSFFYSQEMATDDESEHRAVLFLLVLSPFPCQFANLFFPSFSFLLGKWRYSPRPRAADGCVRRRLRRRRLAGGDMHRRAGERWNGLHALCASKSGRSHCCILSHFSKNRQTSGSFCLGNKVSTIIISL